MPMKASDEPGQTDQTQSPRSAALYIGRMSAELVDLARRHRLEPLAYILEMARIEADQVATGSADAGEAPPARVNFK